MKAAVFQGPGQPLEIKDIAAPEIGDNEMLVKVRRCGICGTDIHASREGPFMAPPETVFGSGCSLETCVSAGLLPTACATEANPSRSSRLSSPSITSCVSDNPP